MPQCGSIVPETKLIISRSPSVLVTDAWCVAAFAAQQAYMNFILLHRTSVLEFICVKRNLCAPNGGSIMLDAIFVAAGFGMFFLAIMYVFACDKL